LAAARLGSEYAVFTIEPPGSELFLIWMIHFPSIFPPNFCTGFTAAVYPLDVDKIMLIVAMVEAHN
jgi:hypothetical protein